MSLFKRKPWTGKTELLFSDKALTALILPLFLEQLLSVFVGLSDSIMVAQVGEAAVSAVSLVDSIAILLINIFNALATGGAVVSGQYLGAKDKKKAAERICLYTGRTAAHRRRSQQGKLLRSDHSDDRRLRHS